jgi:hypothetical protein
MNWHTYRTVTYYTTDAIKIVQTFIPILTNKKSFHGILFFNFARSAAGNRKLIKTSYFHTHEMAKDDMEGNDYTVFHGISQKRLDRITNRLKIAYAHAGYRSGFLDTL